MYFPLKSTVGPGKTWLECFSSDRTVSFSQVNFPKKTSPVRESPRRFQPTSRKGPDTFIGLGSENEATSVALNERSRVLSGAPVARGS
jgi:hypothetical protein